MTRLTRTKRARNGDAIVPQTPPAAPGKGAPALGGGGGGGGGTEGVLSEAAEALRRAPLPEYDSLVDELVAIERQFRGLYTAAQRSRDILASPADYYKQPAWKRHKVSGDAMLQALLDCLARFDQTEFSRSKQQVEMHLLWTMACLPQIYGDEYMSKLPELMRRFGVPSFWSFVAIFATRRFGKTFAMAMFVAAFLWSQQRSVVSIFSIARRTSRAMTEKIAMFIETIVGADEKLIVDRHNEEQLTIINPLGVRSTAYSYPCSDIRFPFSPFIIFLATCLSVALSLSLYISPFVSVIYTQWNGMEWSVVKVIEVYSGRWWPVELEQPRGVVLVATGDLPRRGFQGPLQSRRRRGRFFPPSPLSPSASDTSTHQRSSAAGALAPPPPPPPPALERSRPNTRADRAFFSLPRRLAFLFPPPSPLLSPPSGASALTEGREGGAGDAALGDGGVVVAVMGGGIGSNSRSASWRQVSGGAGAAGFVGTHTRAESAGE